MFVTLLLASNCAARQPKPASSPPPAALDAEATAVARAEEFVKVNGYVARADGDPAKVVRESCCADGEDVAEILGRRAGTLIGAACEVLPVDALGDGPGWTVVFCYDPRDREFRETIPEFRTWAKERGRAVVTDPEGNLRMVHMEIVLHAKDSKALRGMALLEELLRAAAAERDNVGQTPSAPR